MPKTKPEYTASPTSFNERNFKIIRWFEYTYIGGKSKNVTNNNNIAFYATFYLVRGKLAGRVR